MDIRARFAALRSHYTGQGGMRRPDLLSITFQIAGRVIGRSSKASNTSSYALIRY